MSKSLGGVLVCVLCLVASRQVWAQASVSDASVSPPVASDSKDAFVRSLGFRTERIIIDSTHPAIFWLVQNSVASYAPREPLSLKLALAPEAADVKPIRELGTFSLFIRDMVQRPFAVSGDLFGLPDGTYRVVAELMEGEATLTKLEQTIHLVEGLDVRRGDIERRLAKIEGHDSTKASIRYPFDYARVLNIGKRNYNAGDLGINQQSQPNYYDFSGEIKRSETLLASLERGIDLLWQAKGENERHYWMAESGEILPYRVFVPPTWDGKSALPMVFILHGNTRNEDFYFQRDEQIIPKTAAQHGYMLVGVFGFHPSPANYNNQMLRGGVLPSGTRPVTSGALTATGQGRGGAGGGRGTAGGTRGGGQPSMNGMPQSLLGAMSEADTMHVFELVKREYPIDPKRTYLFGYSAGGNGGYWIASNYADLWTAVAIGGAGTGPNLVSQYFDRFKSHHMPFLIFHGEQDTGVQAGSRAMVEAMKENGIDAQLKVLPGANHDSAPSAATPDMFNFFDAHPMR